MQEGAFVEAAKDLSRICLPHFEWEEKTVFPILVLLPDLQRGNVRPDMIDALPMIAEFTVRRDEMNNHHQSILSAVETLLQVAHREMKPEVTALAYNLRIHEQIEDDVVYPTVLRIGKYLRDNLTMH